jgi:FtsH-binding integral membrane protein
MNQLSSQQPWVDVTTVESRARERSFIRSVYGWMFGGLLFTALSALWVYGSPAMQQIVQSSFWILVIAELGLVFFLSFRITKMTPGVAAGSFFVYSILNGLTLSGILFVYSPTAILNAFVASAGMFGAMAIFGLVTKRDLTSWGSFFFMGLIGILIVSLVNIFMKSDGLSFVISVVGVFVFLGLTAYDNQKLKHYAQVAGPQVTNFAVIGALALYLDFINLFLMLLRLFGGRRS